MVSVRAVISMIHRLFIIPLGITIVDLLAIVDFEFLNEIDSRFQVVFIALGIVFYIVAIPHRVLMQRFKRRERNLQIQNQELDLKIKYEKYDLDKLKKKIQDDEMGEKK